MWRSCRNYIILRLQSALYTVVFVVAIILSLVVLVFGNSLHKMAMEYIPILTYVTGIILRLKGMVSIAILAALFMLLYRFVPNRRCGSSGRLPRGFLGSMLVRIFHCLLPVRGVLPGLANMYGSLHHHRAGDAVAVLLHVHHPHRRGDQFLLRGSVPAGILLPADAAGSRSGRRKRKKKRRRNQEKK